MNRFETELADRVARNVRTLRARRGMTQQDLADAAGLYGRSDVSSYERGRQVPSLRTIEKLAAGLSVDPFSLLKP